MERVEHIAPAVRVARGASVNLLQYLGATVFGVIYIAILARSISPHQMGILSMLMFVYTLTTITGGLGLRYAPPKFIPQFLATNGTPKAVGLYGKTWKATSVCSLALGAAFFLIAPWLSLLLTGTADSTTLFQLCAASIFSGVLVPTLLGFVQGLRRMNAYATINFAWVTAKRFLGLGLLLTGMGLQGILYGWIVGDLLGLVMSLLVVAKPLSGVNESFPLNRLLGFSFPMLGYSLILFITGWTDRTLILMFSSLSELGIYQVASEAFATISLVPFSIFIALYPELSEMYTVKGKAAVAESFKTVTRYLLLIFIPVATGAVVFSEPIITIFAGETYAAASAPFAVLCVGAFAYGLTLVISSILMVLGKTREVFIVTLMSFAAFLAGGYVLIPSLGIVGAGISRTILYSLSFALTLVVLSRIIRVRFDVEALWKSLTAASTASILVIILSGLRFTTLLFFLYVALGAVVYLLTLTALRGIHEHDYRVVEKLTPRRLRVVTGMLRRFSR